MCASCSWAAGTTTRSRSCARSPGDNVEFTGWLSDEDLHAIYRRASVYVQASRHEGFGLAVAEAMLAGCVPVVMNVTAMPEVVGDAGVLIDSQDPEDVAAGVRRALELGPEAGSAGARADPHRVPDAEPPRRAARDSRSDPRAYSAAAAARRRAASMENSPMRSTPSAAPGASRRARDALLLELGALVYELHRQGPARARAASGQGARRSTRSRRGCPRPRAPRSPAPTASPPPSPGQLVCLECGETLGAGCPRAPAPAHVRCSRSPRWWRCSAPRRPGFAVSELTSDDGGAGSAAASAAAGGGRGGAGQPVGRGGRGRAESGDDGPVALAAWPEDGAPTR